MLRCSSPGQVLGSYVANRMLTIRLVQWLGWVFQTQERKKERKISSPVSNSTSTPRHSDIAPNNGNHRHLLSKPPSTGPAQGVLQVAWGHVQIRIAKRDDLLAKHCWIPLKQPPWQQITDQPTNDDSIQRKETKTKHVQSKQAKQWEQTGNVARDK